MTSIAILEAVNTTAVQFHGQPVITAMVAGIAYVAMKPIVENLGMSWSTQLRKLQSQKDKYGYAHMNIPSNGGIQEMLCLPLKKLNGWLFSINPERVRADIKDKLIQYQEECFSVLHEYWAKGEVKPKPKKTTTDERTPLRDAVNMLVSKKHLMYPEAYSMIHQRFDVASIEDLEPEQITMAVEYVHRVILEGEFIGKQESLPPESVKPQFSDAELLRLVNLYLWLQHARKISSVIFPALRQMESKLAGDFRDLGVETIDVVKRCQQALIRETQHLLPESVPNFPVERMLERLNK